MSAVVKVLPLYYIQRPTGASSVWWTKLASAESLMKVINTWVGRPADKVGELNVTAIDLEELRAMIFNPHGRLNSGLVNEAWSDARSRQLVLKLLI